MYKIETFPMGPAMANCYIISENGHALMIDPGAKSEKLLHHIKEENLIIDAILLTHGHFDHMLGVNYFKNHFHCDVYIDELDERMLTDNYLNCGYLDKKTIVTENVKNYDMGMNTIKGFEFEVIYAPGHTEGSVMLKFDDIMFSGDVLFMGSIGRTDLPTGSNSKMVNTLNKIKMMDPGITVFPGHGDYTSIRSELLYNPWF